MREITTLMELQVSKENLYAGDPTTARGRPLLATVFCAALALSSCGSQNSLADKATNEAAPKPQLSLTPAQTEMEKLLRARETDRKAGEEATELAKRAMAKVLFDPVSATYLDVRPGKNGSSCGKFNAKNRMGAYVGYKDFVVDKDGNVETSSYNDGVKSETYTDFAQAYLALCASAQERQEYESRTTITSPTPEYDPPTLDQAPDDVLDRPPADDPDDIPTA